MEFLQIKEEYSRFYKTLLLQGRLNCRDTGMGFWGCASPDAVFEFFKAIKLQDFSNFLDLGSGDGIVANIASLFTGSTGIEFDSELHQKAVEIRNKLGLKSRLIHSDYFSHDISGYDFVFINPDKSFTGSGVEKKLLRELRGVLASYNNIFRPNLLRRGRTFWHEQIPVTLWHTTNR